jgi:hypothetical protein
MNERNYLVMTSKVIPKTKAEYMLVTVSLQMGFLLETEANNRRIISNAVKIEKISPEIWNDVHWLRCVGAANPDDCGGKDWRQWFVKEALDEISEYENENK